MARVDLLNAHVLQPLSIFLGLYSAYSFAMIFSFFGSYAYIYTKVYSFDQRQIGLCYIPVIIGICPPGEFLSIVTIS